jgi:hypothetical protein
MISVCQPLSANLAACKKPLSFWFPFFALSHLRLYHDPLFPALFHALLFPFSSLVCSPSVLFLFSTPAGPDSS